MYIRRYQEYFLPFFFLFSFSLLYTHKKAMRPTSLYSIQPDPYRNRRSSAKGE